jgi:hypothetical protein
MKNISLGAAFLLSAAFSFGQNCTPEVITNGRLISPSVEENITQPDSIGVYEQVVTFVVPRDTTYSGNQAEIDHFEVLSIDGLPAGFDFDCNPGDCIFPSLESSCLRLFGDITVDMERNSYPLTVNYEASGRLEFLGQTQEVTLPLTIAGFVLDVPNITKIKSKSPQGYLNYADRIISAKFQTNSELKVYSINGSLVRIFNVEAGSDLRLIVNDLERGIYILDLINENGRISKKIAI